MELDIGEVYDFTLAHLKKLAGEISICAGAGTDTNNTNKVIADTIGSDRTIWTKLIWRGNVRDPEAAVRIRTDRLAGDGQHPGFVEDWETVRSQAKYWRRDR